MLLRRAALISVLVSSGCDYSLDTAPRECREGTVAVCVDAKDHSDFDWIKTKIFAANCSSSDCHIVTRAGDTLKGDIDLDPAVAYESLMGNGDGVFSQVDVRRKLVVPGDPNNSYLSFMLHGVSKIYGDPPYDDPPSDVGYMPQKNQTLCCQKLDAVKRWIMDGAHP